MKINYSWLGEYIDHGLSPKDLSLRLTTAGLEVEGLIHAEGEWILDVKVPPNRPDCLSHLGLARELGNLLGRSVAYPVVALTEVGEDVREYISVTVRDKIRCPRYAGRVVEGVRIGSSPDWLRKKIESVGGRSVNNVVDATNYVLLEYGHPLHAFDLDLIEGKKIIVRPGRAGESFTTLDGNLRVVDDTILLICDCKKPIALAGIMGGANSEIGPETHRVFLESAYFDPATIRRTGKKFFLTTESSYRFERGVDREGVRRAIDRAAQLICESAGGKVARGVVEVTSPHVKPNTIRVAMDSTNRLLGTSLTKAEVETCLRLPGYDVKERKKSGWDVRPPSWRIDLVRREDLIEEIARLIGYEKIPVSLPRVSPGAGERDRRRETATKARSLLLRAGCHEVITYSFVSRKSLEALRVGEGHIFHQALTVRNPLTEDQGIMRTTLLPGLLQSLELNERRRSLAVKIFEIGRVFVAEGRGSLPEEKTMLGLLMAGPRAEEGWNLPRDEVDFYDIKGAVEDIFEGAGISSYLFHPAPDAPYLQETASARMTCGGKDVGVLGRVHEGVTAALGIVSTPFICEMDLDSLAGIPRREVGYSSVSRFPVSVRDVAFIVDEAVPAQRALDSLRAVKGDSIEDIRLFDLFRGGHIPPGKKSFAFRIVFSSEEKTLTDEEVDALFDKMISHVETDIGAQVRKRDSS